LTLGSGMLVMIRAERLFLSKAYFLATVAAFCYCLVQFGLIQFAGTDPLMLIWVRMFVVPGLWLVPALLNLLLSVTPARTGLQRLMLWISCACSSVSLLYWVPSTAFTVYSYGWGKALSIYSLPYLVFLFNSAVLLPVSILIVIIQQRQTEPDPLLQRQRVIITASCVLAGMGVLGTMVSGLGVALYPASILLIAFALMLGAAALLSFRSLESELIAHKLLLTVMFIVPLLGFHVLTSWLLISWLGFLWASALPALLVFLVVLLTPYRTWMEKQVGQFVYRGKYNYQEILTELSQSLVAVVDLDHLADMMVTIVVQTLGVENAALILEEEHEHVYRIRASSGIDAAHRESLSLTPRELLIQRLAQDKALLVVGELRQQESPEQVQRLMAPLAGIKAEVIVPLVFKDRLIGALTLGSKRPAGIFNQGDIEVLRRFAAEAGVAIEHARLYTEAIVDRTTGVFNYHYFIVRLREEVARSRRYGRPISLLLVDVDDFKEFEHDYSLHLGNVLLRDLARRFKGLLRATDILARYTASTFAVIVPETKAPDTAAPAEVIRKHIQDSLTIAERLRRNVEKLDVSKEEHAAGVSASVGVAYFDAVDEKFTAEEFIQGAEQALHQCRQEGGNRVRLREKR